MNIEFTQTQRGKRMLIHNGYFYTKHSTNKTHERYRCQERRCKGSIILDEKQFVINQTDHNHRSNQYKCDIVKINNEIKKAIENGMSIREAITSTTSDLIVELITELPKYENIRDNIVKKRNKILSKRMRKIYLWNSELICRRVNFYCQIVVSKENRFLIFSSYFKRRFFKKIEYLVIDGHLGQLLLGFIR